MSKSLPLRPNAEHLRAQAKDLLKLARAGDPDAMAQFGSSVPTLSSAQLVLAREYGFASWAKLLAHVEEVRSQEGITSEAAERFVELALSERLDALRRWLELYPGLRSWDPVCAFLCGNAEYVGKWLETNSASVKLGSKDWEPLEYVCYSRVQRLQATGAVKCARRLLDAGADPNTRHMYSKTDPIAVLYGASAEGRNPDLVRLLLERGANPNDGESIYHAAQYNLPDILEVLVAHGGDLSGADSHWGNTPLYFLAGHRPTDSNAEAAARGMEWLLDHGADPNVPARYMGEWPLHTLCFRGWGSLVETFLRHGADPNVRRKDGRTPYVLARIVGNDVAANALMAAGADPTLSPEEAAFVDVVSGKSDARLPAHPHVSALFVKLAEIGNLSGVRAMLASGFDPASVAEDGITAMHFAAYCGQADVVEALLAAGAPIDAREKTYGATPLGWTLHAMGENRSPGGDYIRVIRALLAAGADRAEVQECLDDEDAPPDLAEVLS